MAGRRGVADRSNDERRGPAVERAQAVARRVAGEVEQDIDAPRADHGVERVVVEMRHLDPLGDAILEHVRHRVVGLRR